MCCTCFQTNFFVYVRVSNILIIKNFVYVLLYTKHEDFVYQLVNSSNNQYTVVNSPYEYNCNHLGMCLLQMVTIIWCNNNTSPLDVTHSELIKFELKFSEEIQRDGPKSYWLFTRIVPRTVELYIFIYKDPYTYQSQIRVQNYIRELP